VAITLPNDVKRLLNGPNFAHLATLMPNGSPQVAAVWVMVDGDSVLVGANERSQRSRNVARDARVALSITSQDDPYDEATIRGRVVEIRRDSNLEFMDRVSQKYISTTWPLRQTINTSIVLVIEPDRASHKKLPFTHNPST
jgi:PPOX class probable F420-dependent enzyme